MKNSLAIFFFTPFFVLVFSSPPSAIICRWSCCICITIFPLWRNRFFIYTKENNQFLLCMYVNGWTQAN